jgi:L-lactate permease
MPLKNGTKLLFIASIKMFIKRFMKKRMKNELREKNKRYLLECLTIALKLLL